MTAQPIEEKGVTRFRKVAGIESAPLQGESILFHPVSKKFFVLNQTAAYVWEMLDNPVSAEDLARGLCGAYEGVELASARRDVEGTLAQMVDLSLAVAVEAGKEKEAT